MRFELDDTLLDDILFFMENQEGDFLLDTQEVIVIDINNNDYDKEPDFSDNERFIALPEWNSQDGYRMMESFSSVLKNPIVRQELSGSLNRNKGVFRAFRNVLSEYPEVEKLWYAYKEKEMKKEVIIWYNGLREEWGLEPVGIEPEDNTSLVLEDFIIRRGEGDYCFISETINNESTGRINAELTASHSDPDIKALHINFLEVNPAYRGMGLGKTLLSKILEKADEEKLDVFIDIPCETDFFSRSLHLENFKPVMKRFFRISEK